MTRVFNIANVFRYAVPPIALLLVGCSSERKAEDAYCGDFFHLSREDGYEADKTFINAFFSNSSTNPDELTKVYLDKDAIVYDGPLFYKSLIQVQDLYKRNPGVTRIKINSRGGVTLVGLCFGEFVLKKELDVEVTERVFSSAANYIFPAGRKKYLHKNSIVGFHGGESSAIYKDLVSNKVIHESNKDSESQTIGQKWEESFYLRLGINPLLVTAGQNDRYEKNGAEYIGWTFTLPAFEFMNVNSIEKLDGYWEPNTIFGNGKYLFVIDSSVLKE